jgi:methylmalonyl-CoA decarboxylase subunit alpha
MAHEKMLAELATRKAKALGMGGPDKLAKRAAQGVRTPADGKIAGFGRIDGREVGVVSNDFTVLGASSSVRSTARRSSM